MAHHLFRPHSHSQLPLLAWPQVPPGWFHYRGSSWGLECFGTAWGLVNLRESSLGLAGWKLQDFRHLTPILGTAVDIPVWGQVSTV